MNKKIYVFGSIAIIAVLGFGFYLSHSKKTAPITADKTQSTATTQKETPSPNTGESPIIVANTNNPPINVDVSVKNVATFIAKDNSENIEKRIWITCYNQSLKMTEKPSLDSFDNCPAFVLQEDEFKPRGTFKQYKNTKDIDVKAIKSTTATISQFVTPAELNNKISLDTKNSGMYLVKLVTVFKDGTTTDAVEMIYIKGEEKKKL